MPSAGKTVDMSFLAAGSEGLTPMPLGEERVSVLINLGEAFDDWTVSYIETARANAESRGGKLIVTQEEFKRYVMTFIASRVDWVNSKIGSPEGRRAVVSPTEVLRIPTFLHVVLSGIGVVDTEEVMSLGIIFVPSHNIDRSTLLSAEEMIDVSQRLAPLEWMGYEFAHQYDRDPRGAYDLMAMQYIQDTIRAGVYSHNRKAAIAFAPVAYFLGLQQMQTLLGSRIIYADEVTLGTRLKSLSRVDRKAS